MKLDFNKFSLPQMTSNNDGKTSGSGTMGVLICTVGAIAFLMGCIDKLFFGHDVDILIQSTFFVGIGASLLGYRKSKESSIAVSDKSDVYCKVCNNESCKCQKLNS